ncbi:MAG: hypothetical protein ACXW36_05340 [Nitrospira sp.]
MSMAKELLRQVEQRAPENMSTVEARRRLAVNLVFLIYILMLVEGPLRKWFAPELATPIYFLRDPIVVFLYAYCLHGRLIVFDGWVRTWFIFAAVVSLIGIIPYMLESVDGRAWVLGVRTYWLYMPLAFVLASTFGRTDFLRFLRWNIVLAIPYAALIIAQYRSLPSAWINMAIGGDEGVVTLTRDMVRPNGLFTYTGQNVNFSASLVALFISYVMVRKASEKSKTLYLLAAGAIASIAVLSGSRTIYFLVAASLLVTLAGLNMTKDRLAGIRAMLLVACCIWLAGFLFVHIFSDAYETMQARFETAEHSEGAIQHRAVAGLLSFLWPLERAPLLGHGIGIGAPAVNRFLGRPPQEFGEAELERNINELGIVLGLIFIVLRFAFAAYLVIVSLRAARAGHPEFLPLAGFAVVGIGQGQITNSTLNGFTYWLLTGLVLASVQMTKLGPSSVASSEPLLKKRWTPRSHSRLSIKASALPWHKK